MFLGGFIPGVIVMAAMKLIVIVVAKHIKGRPVVFDFSKGKRGLKNSNWEQLLPVLIIVLYFFGITSLIETASFSVIYIFAVEVFGIHPVRLGIIFLANLNLFYYFSTRACIVVRLFTAPHAREESQSTCCRHLVCA